jgi:hypothetical protein
MHNIVKHKNTKQKYSTINTNTLVSIQKKSNSLEFKATLLNNTRYCHLFIVLVGAM